MPAQKEHTDEYITAVLAYIRNSLGYKAKVVIVDDFKEQREATKERQATWTLA